MATGAYIGVLTPIPADLGWDDPVGATFSGGEFVKTGATNWSSGYINTTATASELEITATPLQNSGYCSFGLTDHPYTGDEQYFYPGTEYILYFNPGYYTIYELGNETILFSDTYSANDNFAIKVNNGVVTYYKNDTLVYTSSNPANGEYYCVVAAYTGGNGFNNISAQNTDPAAGTSSEVARALTSMYIGVSGVARKIKKAYIGVANIARLWWSKGFRIIGISAYPSSAGITVIDNELSSPQISTVSGLYIALNCSLSKLCSLSIIGKSSSGDPVNRTSIYRMGDEMQTLTSTSVYNFSSSEMTGNNYGYCADPETDDWYSSVGYNFQKAAYSSTGNSYALAFNLRPSGNKRVGITLQNAGAYVAGVIMNSSGDGIGAAFFNKSTQAFQFASATPVTVCIFGDEDATAYFTNSAELYKFDCTSGAIVSSITLPSALFPLSLSISKNSPVFQSDSEYIYAAANASGTYYKIKKDLSSYQTVTYPVDSSRGYCVPIRVESGRVYAKSFSSGLIEPIINLYDDSGQLLASYTTNSPYAFTMAKTQEV